jgi:adenine-specific DNA-methyltransferase
MSRLTDLLDHAKQLDPQLGKDLEQEIQPLQKRLPFGLNFERHVPEAVELAGHKIRRKSKVHILPPRGSALRGDQRIWTVESISDGVADLSTPNGDEAETTTAPIDDLILVAEFRDRIYPGLRPDGTVECGGDKPFHTVINGENFHVLEQLTFTHEHAVDTIYIDPPYNTGARDWKYNNDYVEGDDLYRHSKWLAFMERRLKLAKRLLKPDDSVLIVTIDEKEYLRLGMLLEQVFPEARIQMVTDVVNPRAGVARPGAFTRTEEYLFYVLLGENSSILPTLTNGTGTNSKSKPAPIWFSLMRTGSNSARADRPNLFYPVWVRANGELHSVGQSIPLTSDRRSVPPPSPGLTALWPIRPNGNENTWQLGPLALRKAFEAGTARVNKSRNRTTINYLRTAEKKRIAAGEIEVTGRDDQGALQLRHREGALRKVAPRSVWNYSSHDAGLYGSSLLSALTPGRKFPFPKSLYSTEDSLRHVVGSNPDAVVLDFFSGSGTTAHAIMRLNKQDGGRRQCISVTNNEVSADEQKGLRQKRLRPGDPDWEKHGISDYVTKPRIRAAITGKTPEGKPIKGDYKFTDEFPMSDGFEENAAFFTLTYESRWRVTADRAFAAIAPILWLRAGAVGRRIETINERGWEVADSYGILTDLDHASDFVAELQRHEGIRIAYVVTDDEGRYQQVASEIPHLETVRLYEDYLRNCESTGDL